MVKSFSQECKYLQPPPKKNYLSLYTAGPHPPRYPRGLDRSNSSISVLARVLLRGLHKEESGV